VCSAVKPNTQDTMETAEHSFWRDSPTTTLQFYITSHSVPYSGIAKSGTRRSNAETTSAHNGQVAHRTSVCVDAPRIADDGATSMSLPPPKQGPGVSCITIRSGGPTEGRGQTAGHAKHSAMAPGGLRSFGPSRRSHYRSHWPLVVGPVQGDGGAEGVVGPCHQRDDR
jgi:hypothetical protein